MRTTLREKLVLWTVGLGLAASFELLLRSHVSPISPLGLAVIAPVIVALGMVATLLLRRQGP